MTNEELNILINKLLEEGKSCINFTSMEDAWASLLA